MILEAGTPQSLNGIIGQLLSNSSQNPLVRSQNIIQNPGDPENHLGDVVELSDEALEFLEIFQTLRQGLEQFNQADLNFAQQRVEAIQERLDVLRNLLSETEPGQRDAILQDLQTLGEDISTIARQIGQSECFSQDLSVEFNVVSLQISQESLEITRTDDGIEIELTSQQTQIVVVQLEIEREQTLLVEGGDSGLVSLLEGGQDLSELLEAFRQIFQQFESLLNEAFDVFVHAGSSISDTLEDLLLDPIRIPDDEEAA